MNALNSEVELQILDSHTGGEPTRTIIDGWPEVEGRTMNEKLAYMREHHDKLRYAVICEPKGHEAIVGALLTEPENEDSETGVIFFNDVGYLGMCGHALLGLVETLRFLGRIDGSSIKLDTPAGQVSAHIEEDGTIAIENVESYLHEKDVSVQTKEFGTLTGDVGYGGNWFFMTDSPGIELSMNNIPKLLDVTREIRDNLIAAGKTGRDGEEIDHIEFYGPGVDKSARSKNFVLCPGVAYDRAPCGTGTSAKMAALYERGKLGLEESWVQESITGSLYEGLLIKRDDKIIPVIKSKAFVYSQSKMIFNPEDPFCWGIPS